MKIKSISKFVCTGVVVDYVSAVKLNICCLTISLSIT